MTCPHCGAPVQPNDRFCVSCGQPMNPADPTRHLGDPVASGYAPAHGMEPPDSYGQAPAYSSDPQPYGTSSYGMPAQPYATPDYDRPAQPYATPGYATRGEAARREENWASGSSAPPPNPYAGTPNTVSSGTMLNGRPVRSGNSGGLLKGLGAAIIALGVILAKFGAAIGSIGFFKFFFLFSLFRWIAHGNSWIVIVVVIIIVAAIWRSRMA